MPDAMGVRRQTVKHLFGTLKAWMGATEILDPDLQRVSTEMSLHVLAYNIKRMIAIIGAGPLMEAIKAITSAQLHTPQPIYSVSIVHGQKHSPPPTSYDAFPHSLGHEEPFPQPRLSGRCWFRKQSEAM